MKDTVHSRRQFLQKAALGSALATGTVSLPVWTNPELEFPDTLPEWMRVPGDEFSNYGQPSAHEQGIIRWISANPAAPGNGVSWTPLHALQGTITPNGLHYERHHNGVPQINPDQHTLLIDGLVDKP